MKIKMVKKRYSYQARIATCATEHLTYCGDTDLGQHRLILWSVAWQHQAITWTSVDSSTLQLCGIHRKAMSKELYISILDMSLKIIKLRLQPYLPGANESNNGKWVLLVIIVYYNMVFRALFLQRALYTVHCRNIMHSRKPSFVITPPFLVNALNRYFVVYAAMKYATFYWQKFIWLPLIQTLSNIHVLALVHKEIETCSSADP